MNNEDRGLDPILDRAISEVRDDAAAPAEAAAAAERAWSRLSGAAPAEAGHNVETIRSCADYRALIPAWRRGELPAARALLVEDHVHGCAACRKTLEPRPQLEAVRPRKPISPVWKWAVAAALLVGIGLGGYYGYDRFAPGPSGPRATVYTLDGALLKTAGGAETALAAGAVIGERESVRTAKDAHAVVRLRDGSLVEMRERTELALAAAGDGVDIRLAGGGIIVQAAKQRRGHLYVSTADCKVSVTGTVFSVSSGIKGSRVSVVEGEVHVDQDGQTRVLHSGDQVAAGATVTPTPVQEDIAWSRDYDKHIAILNEFAKLQKKLEAAPGPGLRYSVKLLGVVPEDALFYASIPNLGPTLTEANRLLHEQMQDSAPLREWWAEKMGAAGEAKLDEALTRIRSFSDYLGQEVVIAVGRTGEKKSAPVLVAEVVRPGLRTFIERQQFGDARVRIVDDPAKIAASGRDELLVYVGRDVIVASPDAALLQRSSTLTANPGAASLAKTAFGARIAAAYQQGVSWLVCADLQSAIHPDAGDKNLQASGFGDLRYLIAERKDVSGRTENHAEVTFSQTRHGVASWLAAPAPMRTLDYISPDATLAVAALAKDPSKMLDDVAAMIPAEALDKFRAETGVNLQNDFVGLLGGEAAFAIDGPALPTPSWKLILEVNDPARFVQTLERFLAAINAKKSEAVRLENSVLNGRTFYSLSSAHSPISVQLTFDNGLLIAAPTRDLIVRALGFRSTGYTLPKSAKFTALLPHDGNVSFSAMVYHSLGSVIGAAASHVQLTPEQRKLAESVEPALILLYGEPDRIQLASAGSFFGVRLEQLLALKGESHGTKRLKPAFR